MNWELPVDYTILTPQERRSVRLQYVREQKGNCAHCGAPLSSGPSQEVAKKPVTRRLFPASFFNYPVHLHHDHDTGETIGAVHNHCNAVLWEYYGE